MTGAPSPPAATPAAVPPAPQSGPPAKAAFQANPNLGAQAFLADHIQAVNDGRPGATEAYQALQSSGNAARIAEIAKTNPKAVVALTPSAPAARAPASDPLPTSRKEVNARLAEIDGIVQRLHRDDPAAKREYTPEVQAEYVQLTEIRDGKRPLGDPALTPRAPVSTTPQAPASAEPAAPGAIIYPGKDATPEQLAEFRAKAGIPDSPDKYAPMKAVEGIEVTPRAKEQWGGAQEIFHKHNASPELVAELSEYYASVQTEGLAEHKKAQEDYDKAVAKNKKEHEDYQAAQAEAKEATHAESMAWIEGEYGDDSDKAIEAAKDVWKREFGADYKRIGAERLASGAELGSHPAIVRLTVRLAELEAQGKG